MKVNLCKTCATPVFKGVPTLLFPQLPVAKAYFIPCEIISLSKISSNFILFDLSLEVFFNLVSADFKKVLKNCLKIPVSNTPDISSLFLP